MPHYKNKFYNLGWVVLAWLVGFTISYGIANINNFNYSKINIKGLLDVNISLGLENAINSYEETPAKESLTIDTEPKPNIPEKPETLIFGFIGDIIPGSKASVDIFSQLLPYTEKPDLMIGNFEGVVADNQSIKCKKDSSRCYSFNGDLEFLELIYLASFDVLNVANNHFNDHGQSGQTDTLMKIQELGIIPMGIKEEIVYINKKNLKIGLVGFSNYSWTNNLDNEDKVRELINESNLNADITIVVFHGGAEGEGATHTPDGKEKYLRENRGNLRLFAHNAVNAGADIVVGSGPHVLRGIERYKGKIIAYSLGNFASNNTTSNYRSLKTSALLEISLDKNGSFISGNVLPLEIDTSGMPFIDLKNTAISNINYLSQADFGLNGIKLDSFGKITSQ